MGAKTPEQGKKTNKPRSSVKCDVCGRKFLTTSAWKSHYKFNHSKTEPNKRMALKKQTNAKPIKKKLVPLHMLKRVNPPEPKETKKTEVTVKPVEIAAKRQTASVPRKPEFECPVCALRFLVYFTAFRHIQNNHCVDEQGEKVAPNSPQLVKPIRIETCASCNHEIRSTIPHDCPKMQAYKDQYLCLGCEQVFCGIVLFQHHVKGLHADEAQNYFFPSRTEFEAWKAELQETTKIEFIRLNKQKSKEIYHCSHQPTALSTATKLCPATIMVREYSRGIHVCYFKEHCGHIIEDDEPLKAYNQYSISLYTKESEDLQLDMDHDNDLYFEFKNMVISIVKDAARVNDATLRDLLGRALEMTTVLKSYHNEDHSPSLIGKSLSDDQISESLDNLKTNTKRKQSFEKKSDVVVVKKVKTKSLSENNVSTRHSRSSTHKAVSFNKDTPKKKQELDKEFDALLKDDVKEPKKTEEQLLKVVLKQGDGLEMVIGYEVKKPEEPITKSSTQSPSSFNDSYKKFVNQQSKHSVGETSTPKAKANVKKKEIMKTKIGQFKVKPVSPKTVSPKSPKTVNNDEVQVPVTPVVFKAKPDIKYVVKEQENDCNILILKI